MHVRGLRSGVLLGSSIPGKQIERLLLKLRGVAPSPGPSRSRKSVSSCRLPGERMRARLLGSKFPGLGQVGLEAGANLDPESFVQSQDAALLTSLRHQVKIKKNGLQTKFKIRCSRCLHEYPPRGSRPCLDTSEEHCNSILGFSQVCMRCTVPRHVARPKDTYTRSS